VRVIDLTAGTLNLSGLTIANGLSAGLGGGIQVGTGTTLNVSQCTFGDNTASNGGALSISAGGTATIDECTFDTNVTTSVGGGALITFGTTTVKNSTFVHNTAPINGGAINVQPAGTLTLLNSTLFDNTSGSLGGAMSNLGTVTAINNTFAANHGSSGAAIATANPNVTIYNNVFADNVGSGSPSALSPDGSFPASSHNVFFNNNVAGVPDDQTGYGTTNPIIASAQPLQPLGDNGGPTQTMLPVPGGAAICAGSVALVPGDLDRDQRGFPRITRHGTCVDAGSVQGAEAIPVLSTPLFVVLAGLLIAVGLRHASRRGRARLA
jgi:hypothetical protein